MKLTFFLPQKNSTRVTKMNFKKKYAGSGVSSEVKEYAIEVAIALQQNGMDIWSILEILKNTNYCPSQRTLFRHMGKIKRGDDMLSSHKNTGKAPLLSEEQWAIVCGWILQQNEIVGYEAVMNWIRLHFDVSVSKTTLSNNIHRLGLSFQLTCKRGTNLMSEEEYAIGYYEFVQTLWQDGFFDLNPKRIICFDF